MSNILNPLECSALSALRDGWIATDAVSGLGFSRRPFESLRTMGLAIVTPSGRNDRQFGYAIAADGWRCIYGFTREQLDSFPDTAPAPFRVWQWPLAELPHPGAA